MYIEKEKEVKLKMMPFEILRELSEEAKTLLKETSESSSGNIVNIPVFGGYNIKTNDKSFGGEDNREKAKWKHGIEQLIDYRLIANIKQNEVFEITNLGYNVADVC